MPPTLIHLPLRLALQAWKRSVALRCLVPRLGAAPGGVPGVNGGTLGAVESDRASAAMDKPDLMDWTNLLGMVAYVLLALDDCRPRSSGVLAGDNLPVPPVVSESSFVFVVSLISCM